MTQPDDSHHRAALAGVRQLARRTAAGLDPGELDAALDEVSGSAGDPAECRRLIEMYIFAARVGGDATSLTRAGQWLAGWSRASARTPHEIQQAVVDGVRFAERLHRARGITADHD